jgi:hypothetical protein
MATPGSAPFTSPGNPGPGRQSRRTPTATPGPRGALARPIVDSDARQLGIPEGTDVEPPGVLEPTSLSRPAWVQGVRNDASVDELIAIQALEDAGYSTASSLPSSSASTPAKAGRHGDTSREYDGGLSRHAGAAVNDAVVANPHDSWANVTVFPDASPIPQRDDPEPLTADEEAELAELEAWAADTGVQSAAARGDYDSLLQPGEVNDQSIRDAAARGDLDSLLRGDDDIAPPPRGWFDRLLDASRADYRRLLNESEIAPEVSNESLTDLVGAASNISRVLATQDPAEMRAKLALMVRQDKGLQKLLESKALSLDDLVTNGAPDLRKLDRLRDLLRDEVSRASESYVKAATVKRAAPQPITGYNPTIPGYRTVKGTKFIVWEPARYADSVPM